MDWDEEALEIAGISREHLSELVPTTMCFQGLDHSTAEAYGINPQTPFIIGANDGCLANLGVGAIEKGTVALTIGTSGAIRTVSSEPVVDPKGRTFCYVLTKDHWVIGGPVNNGGMVLRWLRDEWCQEEVAEAKERGISAYELITEKIDQVRPGAEGLLFHPYLTGERAPSWNAHARGSFFGLAMHHKREHMMRAVLEGINLNIYMVLLALEELIGIPDKIHATGGFAQSSVWRQMVADIFNQDVHVQQTVESSCFGAVVLGLYAMGEIKDLTSVKDFVQTSEVTRPNRKNVETYEEIIPIFIRLSRLFEEEYEAVADLQHKLGQNTDGSNIK
jgi:gluconokinase